MKVILSIVTTLSIIALAFAVAPASGEQYVSAGTFVARSGGTTAADNGVVVCGAGAGVGGVCIPFGNGVGIQVVDEVLGENVAFQVCIDNDGDQICTLGPSLIEPGCDDVILFSHSSDSNPPLFHNPVGPLPTGFTCGNGGGFPGYVVFLCNGVHDDTSGAHEHTATAGTATLVGNHEGSGDFCGIPESRQDSKFYVFAPPVPDTDHGPKPYCEDVAGDQKTHRYGPSTGFIIFLGTDGSTESCPYSAGTENPTFDGHFEYAFGGGWLVAGTNAAQAEACGWPYPDHPAFPTVWVFDDVLSQIPADVAFSVYADTLNNIPPVDPNEPNCGDFESDFGVDCVNHCTIGFPPGLDQTYQVYVNGVAGTIVTN